MPTTWTVIGRRTVEGGARIVTVGFGDGRRLAVTVKANAVGDEAEAAIIQHVVDTQPARVALR